MSERIARDPWIMAIGIGKMLKTVTLVAVGIVALFLEHRDAAEELRRWVFVLGLDPGGRLVHSALAAAGILDAHALREIGVATFLYAALFAIEGTGLLLRRKWGEYVSIVITSSFIPLEIYETVRSPHLGRAVATLLNVAAVAYLVLQVRKRAQAERASVRA